VRVLKRKKIIIFSYMQYLTRKKFIEKIGISRNTLYKLVKEGKIKRIQIGRKYYYGTNNYIT
jgi:excisionase family DNA binding protein